ncbi:DHA2 family efflux MFS transporter permease subunit [Levilactobacillus brevis]|nr:DHA2 family efflux MFS transporter permease subunit [Levilactobacillus brevis]ARW23012.1 Putative multidrug resistance protein MdtD [Levilactobacillus brevis]ARW51630.1 Putative multidrug resistance protein MdtD [Levilactobacillus brevis]KWU39786.1 disulfide bond formation protein DsbA [Levilactobacillus brevis]MBU7540110.1 DHA2 family efflux MFS transporter permease subunit [Levilactobacillus brevis]MBU7559625.1 DHA2 family efflux MFS transporter permease subunit [Levilactobacillus brevis]
MTNKRISRSLIVMVFGTFFGILCSTLMNTGLPQLMTAFHISEAQVQWVTNGYMLVNALMIPVSAYLIKRFLFRNLYILATLIFLAGTLLGALCHAFILVIVARMIQAVGAGMMMPLVNVLAIRYAEPAKKGAIMGIIGLAFNFSPIIGPTVSGVILDYLSWRYLFIIIIPFILTTLVASLIILPKIPHNESPHFDSRGFVLVSIGLWCILMGLSNISTASFLSWQVGGLLLIGLVFSLIFVKSQLGHTDPLINLHVFNHGQFVTATLVNMLIVATMYGNTILLPLLIQTIQHRSALVSGLVILPGALLTGTLSRLSGRLYDRISVKRLVAIGLSIDCAGTLLQALIGTSSSPVILAIFQAVRQLGLVTMLIPLQTHALGLLPYEMVPDGVATFNTIRQVAASFGTAIIIAVVALVNRTFPGNGHIGIEAGFLVCLLLLVGAVIAARRLQSQFKRSI